MKTALPALALLTIIASPVQSGSAATETTGTAMNCPMMSQTAEMQKEMGGMMSEMRTLMDGTTDPETKTRMQRMHDHMTAMMANMQKMHGGLMHHPAAASSKPAEPPAHSQAPASDEHDIHHPSK